MATFTLNADVVRSIATLHNATPARDRDITPILNAISITVTPESWTAVATDRYMVAELTGEMGDYVHTLSDEPFTVLIPSSDLVEYVKRMGARATLPVMFTVSDDGESVEINNHDAIATYRTVTGNYPPVARLFPAEVPDSPVASITLDPSRLARLYKILTPGQVSGRPADRADNPLTLHPSLAAHGSDRPGPILIRSRDERFRGLLQPVTILR